MNWLKVRPLVFILLLLLLILQYELWFQPTGVAKLFGLYDDLKQQATVNATLKARNDALAQKVNALKQGNDVIESRARNELGMIKKGEVLYQIVDKKQKSIDPIFR